MGFSTKPLAVHSTQVGCPARVFTTGYRDAMSYASPGEDVRGSEANRELRSLRERRAKTGAMAVGMEDARKNK